MGGLLRAVQPGAWAPACASRQKVGRAPAPSGQEHVLEFSPASAPAFAAATSWIQRPGRANDGMRPAGTLVAMLSALIKHTPAWHPDTRSAPGHWLAVRTSRNS